MIKRVERVFSVRRDEISSASLLFFYLFLVTGAYLLGQAVGDALFLEVFPRHLPYAMIGSAFMAGAFVAVYIRLSARMRLQMLIISTLLFFSMSFAVFWGLIHYQVKWAYLLILIWVYAAGAICPMMGWTIANYALTTREARRIFGFIGAGALLGGAIISFTAADMLRHGRIHPDNALLGVVAMLACCALLVRVFFRNSGKRLATIGRPMHIREETPRNFSQSLKLIRNSRYLVLLSGLVAVGCVATCILGYQFKLIAKEAYGNNTVGLADFFCRFNGYMGLASFIFQLALTPPLLRTFGIRVTLFVVPVALIFSSVGVLISPTLLMGSILRGSHYVLRFSLDKSSTELLYLPVSPQVRSQVKSFIDTFIWRSADGLAGVTLLISANVLKMNPSEVSMVNLLVLGGWIVVANGIRHEYLNALRQAIERRTLDPERVAAQVLDSTTTEVLAHALEDGSEQQILYGMSLFEMGRHTGWHPALRDLLDHRSPAVRKQALRLLGDAGDREILPRVEEMLGDESPDVRAEVLHYLAVHARRDPLTFLRKGSGLPDHVLQGAVAAYLARSPEQDYALTAKLILQQMITQEGAEGMPARREAARVLGVIAAPSELHNYLNGLLHDDNPEVVEQALLSAGKCRIREFLPTVIEKLGQPRLMLSARAALALYGKEAVHALQMCLNDESVPVSIRRQVPQALARIPIPESASALADSLGQSDPGLRYDVLKALNKLRDHDPALIPVIADYAIMVDAELMGYYRSFQILGAFDLSIQGTTCHVPSHSSEQLLRRALVERMDRRLERIFRLLALLYRPRDIYNAFVGVTSGWPQLAANALEMLEHMLPPELFRRLAGALDPDTGIQKKLDFARQFCRMEVNSRYDALRILLHSDDNWLRTCAVYATGGSGVRELSEDLNALSCDRDPLLMETRNWAMAQLAAGKPA